MDSNSYQNLISDKNINLVYELQENDILHQLVNLEQLTIEVTDACNLKCKYCGYGELYNTYYDRLRGREKIVISYFMIHDF